ncbi:hypothetical protein ACI6PS_15375 [Flavobacterium sp. PLA-1-15]|uniref:hypothetical protein n=1 Tax=Flavobacterium sp. PLA-1-15 TaxID=3380533 RepID=UPI003B7DFCE6
MKKSYILSLLFISFIGCSSSDESSNTNPAPEENLYFPSVQGTARETKTIADLGWNQNNVEPLLTFLEQKNTKGFIMELPNKKI